MNRRNFIKQTGVLAPLVIAFSPLSAIQYRVLQKITSEANHNNKILVLIYLSGGNDSLNTFIPLKQYSILSDARKNIIIPENKILKLTDSESIGLHPSLTGLQKLYNKKQLTIIQGVGYPNPTFSHTKALNIKLQANNNGETGWIGRYLENNQAHESSQLCISLADVSPMISQGKGSNLGIGIANIDFYSYLAPDLPKGATLTGLGGRNIEMLRSTSSDFDVYASEIKSICEKQENLSKLYPADIPISYPPQPRNKLADQLKIVAKLIAGNFKSRVYIVSQDGYDTHGNQVDPSDTSQGRHAKLLTDLSEAITAFEDDMHLMGKQDDVLGMTFSEFGRRIKSNDSYGTDHGTAETVILFGTKLKKAIVGSSPEIPLKPTVNDNLPFQIDFRSLYSSILKGWFGVSEDKLKSIIPDSPSERLELFI